MSNITNQTADEKIAALEAEANKAMETPTEEAPVETKPEEAKATETATEEKPVEEAKPATETPTEIPDEKAEELSQIKPKGQERIKQLADERNKFSEEAIKVPELEKEINRLRNILGLGKRNQGQSSNQPVMPQTPAANPLPWAQQEEGNKELTQEELASLVKKEAQVQIQNDRILSTLEYDISTAEDKYPELRAPTKENPNPEFDEKLANNISRWYETLFAKNRDLRFGDFVEEVMSLKVRGQEQGKKQAQAETAAVVKQQAAEDIIDSSGIASKTDKSLETKIKSAKNSKELAEMEKLLAHTSN